VCRNVRIPFVQKINCTVRSCIMYLKVALLSAVVVVVLLLIWRL